MSYSIDDTQPRSPFEGDPINLQPTLNPEDEGGRGGSCLLNVIIGGMVLLVAVAVVALAAAAGWTSGQREANTHSIATQNAAVSDQVQRIQSDVDSGNTVVLKARIDWLATQTPGVPGIANYVMTATALYLNQLPTATLPPTATPAATIEPQATEEAAITQEASGGYDLTKILNQAESAIASSQWQDAIDYLDVILGADPTFDSAHVNQLMSQALNSYALQLYNANQPAEANLIVTRARSFGTLADGLDYENMAAELYLTAKSAVGTGSPLAIGDLQKVLNLGPGRYFQEAQKLLYNMYVAQGDAYVGQGNNCAAASSYQQAMNSFSSGAANGKYAAAQNACVNAPPTTDPNLVIPNDGSVAPVGQVSPPGG